MFATPPFDGTICWFLIKHQSVLHDNANNIQQKASFSLRISTLHTTRDYCLGNVSSRIYLTGRQHIMAPQIVVEFAEETGIFGLNLMRGHLCKVEVIFWFIATAFFAT